MKKSILVYTIFIILAGFAVAVENTDFLTMQGLSARTIAMGEVNVMPDLGADSVFANPAVLGNSSHLEILTSYARPLAESSQIGIAAGPWTTAYGRFGVGLINFTPDSLTETNTVNILGDLHANDSAVILSYSNRVFENLSYGLNLAYLNTTIGTSQASAWSTDAAISYKFIPQFALSVIGKNIFSTNLKWNAASNAEEKLARQLVIGSAGSLQVFDRKLSLAGQLSTTGSNSKSDLAFGSEYEVTRYAALRIGTNSRYPMTLGLGLYLWQLRLDYAYLTQEYYNSQKITFSILF